MADEQWRPIPSLPGYEASDLGRVRSLDRVIETAKGAQRWRGKVKSQTTSPRGYRRVALNHGGRLRTLTVHGLVAEAWLGPRPDGLHVLHGPGGQQDNRPLNLRYGTQGDNMDDRVRDGNSPQANRQTCPRGHDLVEPNLRPGRKWRECLACHLVHGATKRRRAREVVPAEVMQALADERYRRIMAAR